MEVVQPRCAGLDVFPLVICRREPLIGGIVNMQASLETLVG
jgi:hypothetical protein